jgi:outer membrane receptor protein involved in Fe transport
MASYEVRTHLFNLSGIWRHPSGFFAELGNTWIWQHNTGADAAGDEAVSHLDAVVGFRFPRRQAALSLGVLNLTDEDYRLNPLGFQAFLPRERTYVISASFNVW